MLQGVHVKVLLVLAALAMGLAAGAAVTLYRVVDPETKAVSYTDRQPRPGVRFSEVAGYEVASRPVVLRPGQRKIHVYYPRGDRSTATKIAEDAWYAVRLNERIAGFDFTWTGDIKVFLVPEFEIGSAGLFQGRRDGIMVSTTHPYLMYHEIAHYWVNHDLFRDRWLSEGFAELSAYIVGLRVRGLKSAERFRANKAQDVWDYRDQDFPIETWGNGEKTTVDREAFGYGKAFFAAALLMTRASLHKIQEVHRELRRRGRPVTTREYLDLVGTTARVKDLDATLSGWVLPGPYSLDGRPVSLREAVKRLLERPLHVPGQLDPSLPDFDLSETTRPTTGPATTSRPFGGFVEP